MNAPLPAPSAEAIHRAERQRQAVAALQAVLPAMPCCGRPKTPRLMSATA